jgi:hypothetical protein
VTAKRSREALLPRLITPGFRASWSRSSGMPVDLDVLGLTLWSWTGTRSSDLSELEFFSLVKRLGAVPLVGGGRTAGPDADAMEPADEGGQGSRPRAAGPGLLRSRRRSGSPWTSRPWSR